MINKIKQDLKENPKLIYFFVMLNKYEKSIILDILQKYDFKPIDRNVNSTFLKYDFMYVMYIKYDKYTKLFFYSYLFKNTNNSIYKKLKYLDIFKKYNELINNSNKFIDDLFKEVIDI